MTCLGLQSENGRNRIYIPSLPNFKDPFLDPSTSSQGEKDRKKVESKHPETCTAIWHGHDLQLCDQGLLCLDGVWQYLGAAELRH